MKNKAKLKNIKRQKICVNDDMSKQQKDTKSNKEPKKKK